MSSSALVLLIRTIKIKIKTQTLAKLYTNFYFSNKQKHFYLLFIMADH